MNIFLSFAAFKIQATNKALIRFVSRVSFYTIYYYDDIGIFETSVVIDAASPDYDADILTDWTTNYLPFANVAVASPYDSDNSKIQRPKVTKTGWRYNPRSFDWTTGTRASLRNTKATGYSLTTQTDIGDAVIKYWKADGTAIVQTTETNAEFQAILDADCTATAVEWQPTYDMDVIGATIMVKNTPASDCDFWAIVAPDIPEIYGGRKTFGNGGFNLSYLNTKDKIEINGRGVKTIVYDPVYNTNKFQFFCVHEIGVHCGIQLFFEKYMV